MLTDPQKARSLKVHTIAAADLPTLDANLQTWLDSRTEEVVVGIQFRNNGSANFYAFILYTE